MTDSPQKKPIGDIQDFRTVGRRRSSQPDSQISSNLDSQVVQYQESQQAQLSDTQITERQDMQMVSYLKKKKPERKAQIVYFPLELKERVKEYAFRHKQEISEVVALAVERFLDSQEHPTLEERFRTDTGVHHFKNWLRTHDQPQDSDFAKRFLADTRLPQHASRSLYEAKLRVSGYSEEDIHLFQDAWKAMLFTQ